MKTETLSYHNKEEIKAEYVELAIAHRKADNFIQSIYFKEGKGCAVGCLAQTANNPHQLLQKKTGIPLWLYILQDTIFEGLEIEDAKNFVVNFYKAIPVGKDLEEIKWQFLEFILDENIERVKAIDTKELYKQEVLDAQELCKKLLKSRSDDDAAAVMSVVESTCSASESAWSASESTRSLIESVGWSAESVARSASISAEACSTVESAGWSVAYKRHRDELLRLLAR